MNRPIARKILSDRVIYYSRPLPICAGLPVVADLGEARVGTQNHRGDIMPGIYRAPEVIMWGWIGTVKLTFGQLAPW